MFIISKITNALRNKARNQAFGLISALALGLDYIAARRGHVDRSLVKQGVSQVVVDAVTALKDVGFFVIEDFFNQKEVLRLAEHLRAVIRNHPELIHTATPYDKRLHGVENLDDVFTVFSKHKFLHEIARSYRQQSMDVAFTLGAILSASEKNPGSGGGWHRDGTTTQFKTMVYLSDVGLDDGPFQIVEKSHHFLNCLRDNRIMNLRYGEVRIKDSGVMHLLDSTSHDRLHTLTGKAGTVVIFDSSTIHRGCPINKGERLALTNYFFPSSYITSDLFRHFSPVAGRSS
jgi:Phytanoyl-CoA dioxygenase (PhyH)